MTDIYTVPCFYCDKPLDPTARHMLRRVIGWERKNDTRTSRRGGSDMVLREPRDEYAHPECVSRVKAGIAVGQQALL